MENESSSQDIQQQSEQQCTDIPVMVDQPNSITTNTICEQGSKSEVDFLKDRINAAEKWMIGLTGLIAFVSICAVGVAYLQWDVMGGQLKEMSNSRSQFQQDQRPYLIYGITPNTLVAGRPISVNISLGNYGKSPAVKVKGRGAIFLGVDAMKQADQWFELEAPKPLPTNVGTIVSPGTSATSEKPQFSTLTSSNVVSQQELDFLTNFDFSIVIVSRHEYFDIAGNRYWTDSCYSYLMTGAIPNCPKHNEIH